MMMYSVGRTELAIAFNFQSNYSRAALLLLDPLQPRFDEELLQKYISQHPV